MNTTAVGTRAEQVARDFLEKRGMRCLDQNARTRFYELDLVMRDGRDIVAIEVKYRRNTDFGGGEAAISSTKKWRLQQGILQWLMQQGYDDVDQNIRIDVVVVTGERYICTYYPNAVEDG
jgi:putative endonuclease